MRDTNYVREISRGIYSSSQNSEGRIESLYIKAHSQEEIRFAWWKDGNLVMRPLDPTEDELSILIRNSVKSGAFSVDFPCRLKDICSS